MLSKGSIEMCYVIPAQEPAETITKTIPIMWIQKGVVESFSSHSKAYICGLFLVIIKFIKKNNFIHLKIYLSLSNLEFFYINTPFLLN